jgi:hypothetical protein
MYENIGFHVRDKTRENARDIFHVGIHYYYLFTQNPRKFSRT